MTAPDSSPAEAAAPEAVDAPSPAPRKQVPWLKWGALAVVLLVVAAIVGAYMLPRRPEVTRSITVAAPVDVVFPLVADLRHFPDWSPWFADDPEIVILYTGPTDGVGQTMTWASKRPEVGSGKETVTLSEPESAVEMVVSFAGRAPATAWFRLEPNGALTKVVWGFRTDLGINPVSRYVGLGTDGVIGPDLERGLARLKVLAESQPPRSG